MTAAFPPPPTRSPKPFVLCADDYGLSPGVSSAIRDLIDRERLSATSCMTSSPFWRDHATWLLPYVDQIDVGLHLTLTDQQPIGPMPRTAPGGRLPSLGSLMRLAYSRRLDADEVDEELNRQIDAFEAALGRPPAFIDGHQHVHQLPTIREAVIRALSGRLKGKSPTTATPYLRSCHDGASAILTRGIAIPKSFFVSMLSRRLHKLARKHTIATNISFRGVYDFSRPVPFGAMMDRFVEDLPEPQAGIGLVMCHPGIPDDTLRAVDPVVEQRRVEYDWLGGHGLPALLNKRNLCLSRFRK
ncbi:ChbG/HpnK family deacetylase [Skermanella mucosa]|uniref:ChbG/HpnK family deacetylase n=1 Tax=Skermanella mucosa TaxID=1789672 RepID=UPI00192C1854|nr:ChbG/HpnK family deacetylase [Skermanella mucosa]UEM23326.1 ChbG/HpnK family deacetylase [Skermanella mucosa]